jgi:excisionase family DNA binding protein
MSSPFLLTTEVADRLRCSTRTVHELTRSGRIPHRRLPGRGGASVGSTSSRSGRSARRSES